MDSPFNGGKILLVSRAGLEPATLCLKGKDGRYNLLEMLDF